MTNDDRQWAVHPVLVELQKRILLDLSDLTDNMSSGGCKDYAEYRQLVGEIKGLNRANRHLLDLDIQMDVED